MFERSKAVKNPSTKNNTKKSVSDQSSHTSSATPNGALIAKIITYFTTGQKPASLSSENVSITPDQLANFRSQIRTGEITPSDLSTFLEQIDVSTLDPKIQFHKIANNLHERQILAVMTGYNRKNWHKISVKDLEAFLDSSPKDHPSYTTPVAFTALRDKFLDEIRPEASAEQFTVYETAMDNLARTLYGKRFDYYEQFELLRENTLKKTEVEQSPAPDSASDSAPSTDTTVQSPATLPTNPADASALSSFTSPTSALDLSPSMLKPAPNSAKLNLTLIPLEQREQILNRCVFEGDVWRQDGQEYRLSATNLLTSELTPTRGFSFNNQPFYLSDPFALPDDNTAIIAFIPANNAIKVRSFYYNHTEALWHYLPDYIRASGGNGFGWYGESYAPAATILPHRLQQILSMLEESEGAKQITTTDPTFLFAGTAAAYGSHQEYRDARSSGHLRGDFYREVSSSPLNASVDPLGPNHRKTAPQLLSVNHQIAPNFATPSFSYATYSPLIGQINASAFKANDQSCSWLFFTDYRGRVWIANIEAISPLTSTGCRRDWLYATDLTTPLYEFSTQANNYGDPSDTRKGYTSMWNNYLSKVPLIDDYLSAVQKPH